MSQGLMLSEYRVPEPLDSICKHLQVYQVSTATIHHQELRWFYKKKRERENKLM